MASRLERAIAEVRAGTVTEVNLNDQWIGDAGATQLADALRTNTSVKELNLQCNSIGEAGAMFGYLMLRCQSALRRCARRGLS